MEIKTYDAILSNLCDNFDGLISPRKITRSNTNALYLVFKSFAKGLEVIYNTVLTLSRKFDPARCSTEDLLSLAKLVGTEKLRGSATGLQFTVTNRKDTTETLLAGAYTYKPDEDSMFVYNNPIDREILAHETFTDIAMSSERKSIPITEQSNIPVEFNGALVDSAQFVFSCDDNTGLLGTPPESNLDFRERITKGESTTSLMSKMENEIKQLPYIFDCRVRFNNSASPIQYGNITVPAWNLLVVISGNPTDEVAEIVTKYSIFETPSSYSTFVAYKNPAFLDGEYKVYYKPFDTYNYDIDIYYEADPKSITDSSVKKAFNNALERFKITNICTELLQERTFSNLLSGLGLNTVKVLNVDLKDAEGTKVDYIRVPVTAIARLRTVNVINASIVEAKV